jgi:hypothetical protein
MKFTPGQVKAMRKKEWEALSVAEELSLIKKGFLFVKWTDGSSPEGPMTNHVLNLINAMEEVPQAPRPGLAANFLLTRNNVPVYAVVNGFLIDLENGTPAVPNTMGY